MKGLNVVYVRHLCNATSDIAHTRMSTTRSSCVESTVQDAPLENCAIGYLIGFETAASCVNHRTSAKPSLTGNIRRADKLFLRKTDCSYIAHQNLFMQRNQAHHLKGLFQTLKDWRRCLSKKHPHIEILNYWRPLSHYNILFQSLRKTSPSTACSSTRLWR